jgi:hypothetical protein
MTHRYATLAQITDGKAAWAEFVSGVQQTFDNNAAAVPVLAASIGILILIWADFRLAKWIARRIGKKQDHNSAKR